MGRPTKYKKEFCDIAIECGREGMSLAGIAAEIDVTRDTLYRWMTEHEDFSDAIKRARELALAWWERVAARQATLPNSGNSAALIFTLKNRFRDDYADSHEFTGRDGGPMETISRIEMVAPDVEDGTG